MKKVSVVIPSYNRADSAIRCARSVLASDYPDIDVVIVDDCSEKCDVAKEVKIAMGDIKNLKVVRHESRRRVAASRNTGARSTDGEYVFFLDDDNVLEPCTVRLLVEAIDSGRYAIAAPMAVNVWDGGRKTVWATSFKFSKWMSIPRDTDSDAPYDDAFAESVAGKVFDTWFSPNGYMIRRDTFERFGGFDEWYGFYMEESDLCMRARKEGLMSCIVASAVTWHHHYNDAGDMVLRTIASVPWKAYLLQRNRVVFAWRHYTTLQALSVALVFAPLISVHYALIALRRRRPDIAKSFLTGWLAGLAAIFSISRKRTSNVTEGSIQRQD